MSAEYVPFTPENFNAAQREITALRAENERLREALERARTVAVNHLCCCGPLSTNAEDHREDCLARVALEATDD